MAETRGFLQYMRAHGNTPGPTQRPRLAGALTAVLAGAPASLLLWWTAALESLARALDVKEWLALVLHWCLMTSAGALYGQVFSRAANDRRGGWLFGISYGFLLWMLGPVTALQWVTARPVAIGTAAMGMFASHLFYGVSLGLLFPLIHASLQRELADCVRRRKLEGLFGIKRLFS